MQHGAGVDTKDLMAASTSDQFSFAKALSLDDSCRALHPLDVPHRREDLKAMVYMLTA